MLPIPTNEAKACDFNVGCPHICAFFRSAPGPEGEAPTAASQLDASVVLALLRVLGRTATTPFKPMTKGDVAEVLGVTERTVENYVDQEGLPAPVAIGNRVFWHPDVFWAWFNQRLRGEAEPQATHAPEQLPKRPAKNAASDSLRGWKTKRIAAIESD